MALQGCSFTRTIGQKHNRTRRGPQPILLLAMMALSASSWGEPSGPLTPGARAAVPSSSVPPVAAEPTGQCLPVAQMAHAWLLRLRDASESAWRCRRRSDPTGAQAGGPAASAGSTRDAQPEHAQPPELDPRIELPGMEEAAAQGLPLPPLGDEFVTLVLVRHGESIWNKDNRFTAWMDVPLSTVGLSDARRAANLCRRAGIRFDVAFTSVLHRAVKTCHTILEHIGQLWIPTHSDWRLNERHDGALTGLNKKIAVVHYGKANVTMWRRSYATAPPPLSHTHPGWPGHDPKYARLGVAEHDLPCTESLDDTLARTLPCWGEAVTPALRAGKNVLVVTHGNVVRLLAKLIDGLSDAAIEDIDIPQCTPLVYTFRRGDMRLVPTSRRWAPLRGFFLGDVAAIKAGMKSVGVGVGVGVCGWVGVGGCS